MAMARVAIVAFNRKIATEVRQKVAEDRINGTGTDHFAGLSDEQMAIVQYVHSGQGNLVVVARAGTGKTYLIRKSLPLMQASRVDVATFHSFGNRVLADRLKGARLDGFGKGNAGFSKF